MDTVVLDLFIYAPVEQSIRCMQPAKADQNRLYSAVHAIITGPGYDY